MKVETIEEFVARGGKIKKCEPEKTPKINKYSVRVRGGQKVMSLKEAETFSIKENPERKNEEMMEKLKTLNIAAYEAIKKAQEVNAQSYCKRSPHVKQ